MIAKALKLTGLGLLVLGLGALASSVGLRAATLDVCPSGCTLRCAPGRY